MGEFFMCDTLCAIQPNGSTIFAKNSDRSPNEPHLVVRIPAQEYEPGSRACLTYITVPQAERTLEVILCKPSWTWGAEMGVNSASVAIGNEAVFTKAKRGPDALTGMDLVRLALERSESAQSAVTCITTLLDEYGQGGNCGFDHAFYYDNSFLIADPREGYILETSGRRWVAKRIEDRASISNRLSIHTEHTLRGDVVEGFDFAGKLTDPIYTYFAASKQRQEATGCALNQPPSVSGMMAALRQHNPKDDSKEFTRGSVRSVCMHAGGVVGDHTTGSLVATLRSGMPATLWCTGSSTPCISAFKPVFLSVPACGPVFDNEAYAKQYWLRREAIHRGVLAGAVDVSALRKKIAELEARWIAQEQQLFETGTPNAGTLAQFSNQAALEEQEMIDALLPKEESKIKGNGRFGRYWAKKNTVLGKE
jgi:secernin